MSSTWNLTVDDTSPLLVYLPYAEGSIAGWASVRDPTGQPSFHVTNGVGSSVSLTFYGTGIQFMGTSNTSYDAQIDSEPPATGLVASDQSLYSRDNLTIGAHTVTLISKATDASTVLTLDKALVFNTHRDDHDSPTRIDNSNKNDISYVGSWAPLTNSGVPSVYNPKPFHTTVVAGDQLSFSFKGSAVAVYGSSNNGHGLYSATLDGQNLQYYNASTYSLVGNTAIYYQDGLDSTQTHTVDITNVDPNRFSISYIDIYEDSLSSRPGSASNSSQKSTIGVIAGAVVAGVVVCILAIGGFWWFRRRSNSGSGENVTVDLTQLPVRDRINHHGEKNQLAMPRESNILRPRPYTMFYETPRNEIPLRPDFLGSPLTTSFGGSHASMKDAFLRPNMYPPSRSFFSDADTSVVALPPPSTPGSPTTLGTQPQPNVDIDTIITMLAHRIDAPRDPSAPLPEYRG